MDRILVVENNPLVTRAMEAAGHECDYASDGWEAIRKLETEDYAAIVIDADLPRLSGFGVLTYLREEVGDLDNVFLMTSLDCEHLRSKVTGEHAHVIDRNDAVAELKKFVRSSQ